MARDAWRTRGYLPHFNAVGEVQHVIFRLADALPTDQVRRIEKTRADARAAAVERSLDAGFGSRALAQAPVADIVQSALLHFDERRYGLCAWCVMPTHVHVLVRQAENWPLSSIVHTWKSFTAAQANRVLGRVGPFWAREYFDRAMRSEAQTERAGAYIEANPVVAGLCRAPEDWPWSSAGCRVAGKGRAGWKPAVQETGRLRG